MLEVCLFQTSYFPRETGFWKIKSILKDSIISAFRLLCSIIEANLNHLYGAQLITLLVNTAFNSSRSKESMTTKRRRSFAFAFECNRSSRQTIN